MDDFDRMVAAVVGMKDDNESDWGWVAEAVAHCKAQKVCWRCDDGGHVDHGEISRETCLATVSFLARLKVAGYPATCGVYPMCDEHIFCEWIFNEADKTNYVRVVADIGKVSGEERASVLATGRGLGQEAEVMMSNGLKYEWYRFPC